jgi:hypothetical protein
MIRKLASSEYRLYFRKINPRTGKRRNLGTFLSKHFLRQFSLSVTVFTTHA